MPLIAILIKNEKTPLFQLIKTENIDDFINQNIDKLGVDLSLIESVVDLGTDLFDFYYLKNLENINGELFEGKEISEDFLDINIRRKRDSLLEGTDVHYMKFLSMGNEKMIEKINENKQFLRDLTKKTLFDKDGNFINLFFNIADLLIVDPGLGYMEPPNITISKPSSAGLDSAELMEFGSVGVSAKATCSIKDGKIDKIFMKNWGSGYVKVNDIRVIVEPPSSTNGKTAILKPMVINAFDLPSIINAIDSEDKNYDY